MDQGVGKPGGNKQEKGITGEQKEKPRLQANLAIPKVRFRRDMGGTDAHTHKYRGGKINIAKQAKIRRMCWDGIAIYFVFAFLATNRLVQW